MAIDLDKIKRWVETKTIPDGEIFVLIERCRRAEAGNGESFDNLVEAQRKWSVEHEAHIRNAAYERAATAAHNAFCSPEANVIADKIRKLKSAQPDEEQE